MRYVIIKSPPYNTNNLFFIYVHNSTTQIIQYNSICKSLLRYNNKCTKTQWRGIWCKIKQRKKTGFWLLFNIVTCSVQIVLYLWIILNFIGITQIKHHIIRTKTSTKIRQLYRKTRSVLEGSGVTKCRCCNCIVMII